MMKWKNYGLWVSLGSLVIMLATDLSNVTSEEAQKYVNICLSILVAAGVINSPEKGKGYKNKEDKNSKGGV